MDAQAAKDVLDRWVGAVNRGDVAAIAELYDERAVLLPTFSNQRLDTPARLRGYFDRLGSRAGLKVTPRPATIVDQPLPGGVRSICGIYSWSFEVEGELLNFEARFSFTIDPSAVRPILHHHSSQVPRML